MVIDKKDHVGGAVYTEKINDIHTYANGPHVYRTDNKDTWGFVRKFSEFNNYMLNV